MPSARTEHVFDKTDKPGIHPVHQAAINVRCRAFQDEDDPNRDHQADHGVGERDSQSHAGGPRITARDVSASVLAWWPSATSAAEPILDPTRIRYEATQALPRKPTTPAAATRPSPSSLAGGGL
jgi:hypothetical protein